MQIIVMEGYWKILRPRRKDGRHIEFTVAVAKETAMFLYGLSLSMLITEVVKLATGSLRPHFLQTCRPLPYNCTPEGLVLTFSVAEKLASFAIWESVRAKLVPSFLLPSSFLFPSFFLPSLFLPFHFNWFSNLCPIRMVIIK